MRFGDWDGSQYISHYNEFYLGSAPEYKWSIYNADSESYNMLNTEKSNLCGLPTYPYNNSRKY